MNAGNLPNHEKYFSIQYARQLYETAPKQIVKDQLGNDTLERDLTHCKNYIKSFFIPIGDGLIAQKEKHSYQFKLDTVIKKVYFKRLPKELTKFFFEEYETIRRVITKIDKPKITDKYINMFGGYIHEKKPYHEYPQEIKDKVNIFNKYILEVLADNNQKSYEYLINWYANVAKGIRNESALYLRGPQGTGKSTVSSFLKKYVLGPAIAIQCNNSATLKEKFNSTLMGKVFVCYEELPTFSDNEWKAISSILKARITSSTDLYEAKGKDPIAADNYNNYQINTNVRALKDDDGRRYYILSMSTQFMGNHQYWENIYTNCFNNIVGEAYYNYLLSIDTSKFESQRDMPLTNNKIDSLANNLCHEYKFLKTEFILKKKNINHTLTELFTLYNEYINKNLKNYKTSSNIHFRQKLSEIGIESRKSNGKRLYKKSWVELNDYFEKKHWIHELDHEVFEEGKINIKKNSGLDFIDDEKDKQIQELSEANEQLTKKLKALQDDNREFELINENNELKKKYEDLEKKYNELLKQKTIQKDKPVEIQKIACDMIKDVAEIEEVEQPQPKPRVSVYNCYYCNTNINILRLPNGDNVCKECYDDKIEHKEQKPTPPKCGTTLGKCNGCSKPRKIFLNNRLCTLCSSQEKELEPVPEPEVKQEQEEEEQETVNNLTSTALSMINDFMELDAPDEKEQVNHEEKSKENDNKKCCPRCWKDEIPNFQNYCSECGPLIKQMIGICENPKIYEDVDGCPHGLWYCKSCQGCQKSFYEKESIGDDGYIMITRYTPYNKQTCHKRERCAESKCNKHCYVKEDGTLQPHHCIGKQNVCGFVDEQDDDEQEKEEKERNDKQEQTEMLCGCCCTPCEPVFKKYCLHCADKAKQIMVICDNPQMITTEKGDGLERSLIHCKECEGCKAVSAEYNADRRNNGFSEDSEIESLPKKKLNNYSKSKSPVETINENISEVSSDDTDDDEESDEEGELTKCNKCSKYFLQVKDEMLCKHCSYKMTQLKKDVKINKSEIQNNNRKVKVNNNNKQDQQKELKGLKSIKNLVSKSPESDKPFSKCKSCGKSDVRNKLYCDTCLKSDNVKQCSGIKKDGEQCKLKTVNNFCIYHNKK
jgi:hypothetical protein